MNPLTHFESSKGSSSISTENNIPHIQPSNRPYLLANKETSVKSRKLIAIFSGLPRLIRENWQSIKLLAEQDYLLYSFFFLWDSPESEECASFINQTKLNIHVELEKQPAPNDLADLYKIEPCFIANAGKSEINALFQYHGLKLAYEHSQKFINLYSCLTEPFYLRFRPDLFFDNTYANTIRNQLFDQLLDEVVFPGAKFGNGFNDYMWLCGPRSSHKLFALIDGLTELYSLNYSLAPEVCLKAYVDKHLIHYSINRNLPSILLHMKNGKLVKRRTASFERRKTALLSSNRKQPQNTETLFDSIGEAFKGIPVDLRTSYELWRIKRR